MDPAFREKGLQEAFREWHLLLEHHPNLPDFYFWLENQKFNFDVNKGYKTQRSDSKDPHFLQENLVVFSEDGCAYTRKHILQGGKSTEVDGIKYTQVGARRIPAHAEGQYLYNIDRLGRLYISDVGPHSNILQGEVLLSAGWISFNTEGFINYISNASGHYAPSGNQLRKALEAVEIHYKNKNIFSHLERATVVSPHGNQTSFKTANEISGAKFRGLSFLDVYQNRELIPKILWEKIHIGYEKEQGELVNETLEDLFEKISKIDFTNEQVLHTEEENLRKALWGTVKLTPESQRAAEKLFHELNLEPYRNPEFNPETEEFQYLGFHEWSSTTTRNLDKEKKNPEEYAKGDFSTPKQKEVRKKYMEFWNEIKDFFNGKPFYLEDLEKLGSLYLSVLKVEHGDDYYRVAETPLMNSLIQKIMHHSFFNILGLYKKITGENQFREWEDFCKKFDGFFPGQGKKLFLTCIIGGVSKNVPMGYEKTLESDLEKIREEIASFQFLKDSQEWVKGDISQPHLKKVVYSAPEGVDLYDFLNKPLKDRLREISKSPHVMAGTIQRAWRAHRKALQ